jgi:hypothetical protein
MRSFLYLGGSVLASVAFQSSVLVWPQTFQSYGWAVKYIWIACGIFWILYFLTHRSLFGVKNPSLPSIPGPVGNPVTVNVNPNISPTISPQINVNVSNTSQLPERRPKITFEKWDTRAETMEFWQSGFILENHGEAALEVRVKRFQIAENVFADSAPVSTISAGDRGFALVWLEGISSIGFELAKWNLRAAMKKASDARDGGKMYRPDYAVPVAVTYRDTTKDGTKARLSWLTFQHGTNWSSARQSSANSTSYLGRRLGLLCGQFLVFEVGSVD